MPVEVYIHTANVLYLLSYLVRKIFLLRFLTIIAGLVLIPYFFLVEGGPLFPAIIWGGVFFSVNVFQLIVLFRSRRPVKLSAEILDVYEMGFTDFSTRQFHDLIQAGEETHLEADAVLLTPGSVPSLVYLILEGTCEIKDSSRSEFLQQGDFVGDLSFATKSAFPYEVKATAPLKVIRWTHDELTTVLNKHPELKSTWQNMISNRLAKRLTQQGKQP